jgi:hypothetical protein
MLPHGHFWFCCGFLVFFFGDIGTMYIPVTNITVPPTMMTTKTPTIPTSALHVRG